MNADTVYYNVIDEEEYDARVEGEVVYLGAQQPSFGLYEDVNVIEDEDEDEDVIEDEVDVEVPVRYECVICYEHLDTTRNNCVTSCGHQFCMTCFIRSIQTNNACPLCRQTLYTKVEETEEDDDEETIYTTEDDDEEDEEDEDDEDDTIYYRYKLRKEDLIPRLVSRGITHWDLISYFCEDIPNATIIDGQKDYTPRKLEKIIENILCELEDVEDEMEMMGKEDRNIYLPTVCRDYGAVNILVPRRKNAAV